MKIIINGTGIAGSALAFWLHRLGHEVLLVERAPRLREGGFVVNLWGIGYDAVERMGLLPKLLELQHVGSELRMVDRNGRTRGGYPASVLLKLARGRMASLARSDIAATLYAALGDQVDTLFGDSICA
ncbi:MAG: hypothetical protein Q8K89_13705, partial [Actinomycetota bacterium]|nr:hypothetical protein [Actinomycetota bacterium]